MAQHGEDDPLIGVKLGSEEGLEILLKHLTTSRGVHAETLMATAGALAGQSVQAALWEEARQEGEHHCAGLHLVRCQDDSCFWVGDPLNRSLMEGYGSPWQVLSETARQEGCQVLPSAEHLLLEGLARLGTPAFGRPQVPVEHSPQVIHPIELDNLWSMVRRVCETCGLEASEWPLMCGLVAARAMRLVKPVLKPDLALRLAMDAAIDAAKRPLGDTTMAA
jgi:hypothetical protein